MEFTSFDFHPKLQETLAKMGFVSPTPIQEQALPVVMEGKDVMGLAQTGTGKTAAFALPIINNIANGGRSSKIKAVILAPTRELAQQIFEVIQSFSKGLDVRSMTIYGGASMARQVHQLKRGVDIVVACPGRLFDHMRQGTIHLDNVQALVLDEADQMFDMGFIPTVRRIIERLPENRQNLMFSATMPRDIRSLANDILHEPVNIEVANTAPVATVTHALYPISQGRKQELLLKLLEHTDTESVLVFVKMKHTAKRLAEILEDKGLRATCLQGNLSQGRRLSAMRGFKSGEYQIMVATDIAARGIDISSISHVINFDTPDTAETYTHRIGRTGRAAKTGDAFTLVTPQDRGVIRDIERIMGVEIERKHLEGFEYGADHQTLDANSMRNSRGPRSGGGNRSRGGSPRHSSGGGRSGGRFGGGRSRNDDRQERSPRSSESHAGNFGGGSSEGRGERSSHFSRDSRDSRGSRDSFSSRGGNRDHRVGSDSRDSRFGNRDSRPSSDSRGGNTGGGEQRSFSDRPERSAHPRGERPARQGQGNSQGGGRSNDRRPSRWSRERAERPRSSMWH